MSLSPEVLREGRKGDCMGEEINPRDGEESYESDVDKTREMAIAENPIREVIRQLPSDVPEGAKDALLKIVDLKATEAAEEYDQEKRHISEFLKGREANGKKADAKATEILREIADFQGDPTNKNKRRELEISQVYGMGASYASVEDRLSSWGILMPTPKSQWKEISRTPNGYINFSQPTALPGVYESGEILEENLKYAKDDRPFRDHLHQSPRKLEIHG